ncbi:MAG: glycosyltransferase [Rhodospirillaceae bacterium]
MRLLRVIARLDSRDGGPPLAAMAATKALAKRGHHTEVFSTFGSARESLPESVPGFVVESGDGYQVSMFPCRPPWIWKRAPTMIPALKAILPEIDLVIVHGLHLWISKVVPALCKTLDKPYVLFPHGALSPEILSRRRPAKALLEAWFQSAHLRDAAGLHFTAPAEQALAPAAYGRSPAAFVCPQGVDLAQSTPFSEPVPVRSNDQDGPVLLYLGRLHEKKGLPLILEALARLSQGAGAPLPQARAVLAGPDGGMREALERQISALGLEGRVALPGEVTGAAKEALFRQADFFLLPSAQENFANAMVEAMAFGVPVLISPQVETAPMVTHAGAGLAVSRDATQMAEAMLRYWRDPKRRQEMGNAGARLVHDHLGWDRVAEHLERIYETILQTGRPPQKGLDADSPLPPWEVR